MLAQYASRKEKELNGEKTYWGRVETADMGIHDCAELTDDSVTHMLAEFVVFLVPEPVKAVEAMKSKLISGGVLASSSWKSSDWQELMYYPKKVRPDLVMPTLSVDWTQPEGVRKNLHKIGFNNIQVEQTEGFWSFTDYDEIRRFILTKMPSAARVIAQMSDEEVFKTHALMVSALKANYSAVPAKVVGKAIVACCLK